MNKAIYITSNEADSGKSILTIGLFNALLRHKPKVGYFRPVIDDTLKNTKDNHINTVLSHFSIDQSYEDTYGYTMSDLVKLLNNSKKETVLNTIIDKYKKLEARFDFMVVEGSDFSQFGSIIELDLNIDIAKNLGLPVVLISGALHKSVEDCINSLHLTYDSFVEALYRLRFFYVRRRLFKNVYAPLALGGV